MFFYRMVVSIAEIGAQMRRGLLIVLSAVYLDYFFFKMMYYATQFFLCLSVFTCAPSAMTNYMKNASAWAWECYFTKPSDWVYANYLYYKMDERVDVVVSHYKEDLFWLNPYLKKIDRLYLYCKDPDLCQKGLPKNMQGARLMIKHLPNEGREANTYLYHIISHYDTFSDRTVFTMASLNGNWMRKLSFIFSLAETAPATFFVGKKEIKEIKNFKLHTHTIVARSLGDGYTSLNRPIQLAEYQPLESWMWQYFGYDLCAVDQRIGLGHHGAIFSVTRENIRKFPLKLYKRLLLANSGADSMEAGYYMERVWRFMFSDSVHGCVDCGGANYRKRRGN